MNGRCVSRLIAWVSLSVAVAADAEVIASSRQRRPTALPSCASSGLPIPPMPCREPYLKSAPGSTDFGQSCRKRLLLTGIMITDPALLFETPDTLEPVNRLPVATAAKSPSSPHFSPPADGH